MKKIAFLICVSVAFAASATSVAWKSNALSFDTTSLKKSTDVVGYLVYLSSGSLASSYVMNDSFSAATVGTIVSSDTDGANKGGQVTGTAEWDYGTYKNNDKFALVLSYADSASGKTYWQISSTVNTLAGISDETSIPTAFNNYDGASTVSSGSSIRAGDGWVAAVPEPSTAALALAGLALLLKRRKA